MDDQRAVTQIVLSTTQMTLAEAGHLADQFTAQETFARYQKRQAPDTLRRHRADLSLFATYLHQTPGLAPCGDLYGDPTAWSGMSKGLVEGFVQWQFGQGYAIGSVNMRLSTVRLYARLAQSAGVLDEHHAAMIRTVQGYRGRKGRRIDAGRSTKRLGAKKAQWTELSVAQAHDLFNQPDTPQGRRDRLLLCLLLYHGLRCEEVAALTVEAFDLTRGTFRSLLEAVWERERCQRSSLNCLHQRFAMGGNRCEHSKNKIWWSLGKRR
ncbi:MAG TPA: hypothetical protein VFB12_24775 [Ktedonobacteraceae bacterium]|nr:hypothetical protein [Ktedonobacteraceae bacterium]